MLRRSANSVHLFSLRCKALLRTPRPSYCSSSRRDEEEEYFELILREYPNIASKGERITQYYENINAKIKGPFRKTDSIGSNLIPNLTLGRRIETWNAFQIRFENEKKESISLEYGSTIVCSGFRAEAGLRCGYYFTTGLSQILPEVPRIMEIEKGWDLSLLHINIAKFQVHELPTQRFWMVSANFGVSFGFQRLNGVLYVNGDNYQVKPPSPATTLWNHSYIVKGILVSIAIGFVTMLIVGYRKPKKSIMTPVVVDRAVDSKLSQDLYDIQSLK